MTKGKFVLIFIVLVVDMLFMPAFGQTTADAWNNEGVALYKQGKYNEAIEACDEALILDPNNIAAWFNKGLALRKLGKYNEAIEAYDEALMLDPSDAEAWNSIGIALDDQGYYEDAIEAYNEALGLDPNYVTARQNKDIALKNLSRLDEAVQHYIQTLEGENDTVQWNAAEAPDDPMPSEFGENADPTQRLKTLKNMIDAGLITQEEYDAKRAEILATI